MSTNAFIGLALPSGKVRFIYCGHDGYIEKGVGDWLKAHYVDVGDAEELLGRGDLAALCQEIETYADLGYEGTEAREANSVDEYNKHADECMIPFAYLFIDKHWVCYHNNEIISL